MKSKIDEKIIRVTDLLEQIKSVNEMIQVHSDDATGIMKSQYEYRRNKFLKELGIILKDFNIQPADLAA